MVKRKKTSFLGLAIEHDQVRAGLREQRRERRLRRQHGSPHLAAGGQPGVVAINDLRS